MPEPIQTHVHERPAPTRLEYGFDELRPPMADLEATAEAVRCLECGGPYAPAPCTVACPAEIDVPGFISAIARGEALAAADMILQENPLGGSCARVCPVEELCEGACVMERDGQPPVEIGRLQRFATDRAFSAGAAARSWAGSWNGHRGRVSVIGAGPAGLTCAGELAAGGFEVTVYDAREDFGGLIRYAIAPYRQVREPLPAEVTRIESLGVEFRMGEAIDTPDRLAALEAESDWIFLGVGLGSDVEIEYPGDDLPGVWQSLEFIEAIKLGRPPAVGHAVVVIGGGNTAIDVAREALRLGARPVTLIYRRTESEMPAYRHEVDEARDEGVRFGWLTLPVRFLGDSRLQAVECQRMRLGEPDPSGRPRPEPIPGSEFAIPARTAIKAIGQKKRTEFLSWIDGLELDGGLIRIDPKTGRTTNPKYFAGGDAVNGGATVVEAVRAGKRAARGIERQLRSDAR